MNRLPIAHIITGIYYQDIDPYNAYYTTMIYIRGSIAAYCTGILHITLDIYIVIWYDIVILYYKGVDYVNNERM